MWVQTPRGAGGRPEQAAAKFEPDVPGALILLLSPWLLACASQELGAEEDRNVDTGSPASDTTVVADTGEVACSAELLGFSPSDGDDEVSVAQAVEVWFDAPVDAPHLELFESSGKPVEGATHALDDRFGLSFVPDVPLAYGDLHTLVAEACGERWEGVFTTLPEPALWEGYEGRAFVMGLDELAIDEPAVLAELFDFLGMEDMATAVWVEHVDADARTVELAVAATVDVEGATLQDACEQVAVLEPADFAGNPLFAAGPGELGFEASGVQYAFHALQIEGRFAEDGEHLETLAVDGWLDLEDLRFSGEAGCEYLGHLGLPCEACPDDGDEACLHVTGSVRDAPWDPDLVIDVDLQDDCE